MTRHDHESIKEHPQRDRVLLHGSLGQRVLQFLDIGGDGSGFTWISSTAPLPSQQSENRQAAL